MEKKTDAIERGIAVGVAVLGMLLGNYTIAGIGIAWFILKIA